MLLLIINLNVLVNIMRYFLFATNFIKKKFKEISGGHLQY